jgi:hypothetical protein
MDTPDNVATQPTRRRMCRPRRRLHRDGRRELLWAAAGFAVLQVALALGLERFWPQVRDPEYRLLAQRLDDRRAEAPQRLLLVVLGSSRTALGLRAEILSETPSDPLVFNFGVPAAGPMMQQVCLRRLLADGVRPAGVVIEVMPALLSQRDRYPQEEAMLDPARLTADEIRMLAGYYHRPDRLLLPWCTARLLPVRRHQAEMRDSLNLDAGPSSADPLRDVTSHGWRRAPAHLGGERKSATERLAVSQYRSALGDARVAPGPIKALGDLLTLCRGEDIPAMLLLMPEDSAFRALHEPAAKAACDRALARLSRDFDVPLVDARAWVADGGFWDGHHLTPRGAERFTRRFRDGALARLRLSETVEAPDERRFDGSAKPQAARILAP